jgi:hypothetical protein
LGSPENHEARKTFADVLIGDERFYVHSSSNIALAPDVHIYFSRQHPQHRINQLLFQLQHSNDFCESVIPHER